MRSVAYPSYTINDCQEVVETIYEHYGGATYLDRSQIAESLGLSEGSILKRVSTCTQYGLLEMQKNVGYKPTELFLKISKPRSEDEKHEALLQAFQNPPLYEKIISQYDGHQFPKAFSNILFREFSISSKVSDLAASIFLENANSIGLIDSNHKFTVHKPEGYNLIDSGQAKGLKEEDSRNSFDVDLQSEREQINTQKFDRINAISTLQQNDQRFHNIEIPLINKRKAIISVPIDINKKDLAIIEKQIEVIALYIETEESA